ncbi:MAG: DUF3027 domain-containing protein [Streptosporangiales bacterium]|nr:DUF3027 domain-containing protein [Streptosporangiales bacterium]
MPPAAVRTRTSVLDAACAEAVDLARAGAVEAAPSVESVGEHLGVEPDGERVASHLFACTDLAYHGWRWSVTVTRASRSRTVTISEVTLLPGVEAIVAPAWVPWNERVRPGDLGPGDLLPTAPDDARLQPGYVAFGDDVDEADDVDWWEPGLGRVRVLSPEGRSDAAERWYEGEHGPEVAIAQQAPATCASCGFLLPLGGSLRQLFGVCANEMVPADGTVVSLDHGCGGHSEAAVSEEAPPVEVVPAIDEESFDIVEVDRTPAPVGAPTDEPVEAAEAADEPLGHS